MPTSAHYGPARADSLGEGADRGVPALPRDGGEIPLDDAGLIEEPPPAEAEGGGPGGGRQRNGAGARVRHQRRSPREFSGAAAGGSCAG